MNWYHYLALLNWQNQTIAFSEFEQLKLFQKEIQSPEHLLKIIQNSKTKEYILENPNWWKQAEGDYLLCQKNNIQLTYPYDACFPKLLYYYKDSPTLLSYQGYPCWNHHFALCIVGSRKSSPSTQSWMDHYLTSFVKKHSICILSGGARGVDQKAHGIAIRSGNPTLCFVPSGLLRCYPSSLSQWKVPVLKNQGALISPFHPLDQVRVYYFHRRNSLMVRMAQIVFVTQAERKSGSMLTARFATHYGVSLCTLPGPVMNPLFTGNLQLINDGALFVQDEKDLEALYQIEKCRQKEIHTPV